MANSEVEWLDSLRAAVEHQPIAVIRLSPDQWEYLQDSRRGPTEFSLAFPHALLKDIPRGTVALLQVQSESGESLYVGLIRSKGAATTLDSRIKIVRTGDLDFPVTLAEIAEHIQEKRLATDLRSRIRGSEPVIRLSPKLSVAVLDVLANHQGNRGPLRVVAEARSSVRRLSDVRSLQGDAVRMALRAFGIGTDDRARQLELVAGRETALTEITVIEDAVIEHDARAIPGFTLASSDVTGRAIFERAGERLEVITANRRPLEGLFGVDLIYLNEPRRCVVMLQYKMLEREGAAGAENWVYRTDAQFRKELARMQPFRKGAKPSPGEYRLNPEVFYFKFVKRMAAQSDASLIVPLDHLEVLMAGTKPRGSRGSVRISYDALEGRYLRQTGFVDLLRSGYIGAYATTTADLTTLIEATIREGRALVVAVQSRPAPQPSGMLS